MLLGLRGENVSLPEPLLMLLKDVVKSLASGRSLVLIPEEMQLTTHQAAELLGMSGPYVIRLLGCRRDALLDGRQAPANRHARCVGLREEKGGCTEDCVQ